MKHSTVNEGVPQTVCSSWGKRNVGR